MSAKDMKTQTGRDTRKEKRRKQYQTLYKIQSGKQI